MKNFLQQIWWGNSVQQYAIVLAEIIVLWVIYRLFKKFIVTALKKITARTATQADDAVVNAAEKFILPYIFLTIIYGISEQLHFTEHTQHVLKVVIAVITAYYFVRFINHALQLTVILYMHRKQEPPARFKQLTGILLVIKAVVWIVGILMLIETLGYNITTIITGLGIGGIAIALAAQNILGDLFSYFVIFFDKPFEIGDFITVNTFSGTVERIGIKTSHLRSITGEQLIVPNADMVKSTIKNFKRLETRGIIFKTNVRYDTPEEKLRMLPQLIESIISKQPSTTFNRCHLISFGDFSISFETMYQVKTADFQVYLNTQQNIYLEILNLFRNEGIDFAFPGQTFILQHPVDANLKK